MLVTLLILTVLNSIGLIIAGSIYFKETYTIVRIEQWNEIVHIVNEVTQAGLLNEEGELEVPQELAGGCGFFRDEIPEVYEDEEEEEGDKKKGRKK